MIRLDPPSPEKTPSPGSDAYPRIALVTTTIDRIWTKLLECSIKFFSVFHWRNGKHFNWMGSTAHCTCWVNPLPDGTSSTKREPEKKTRFAGLFFLTGLRPVLPLGQCSPSKSVTLHRKCLHKSAPSPLVSACRQVTTQPLDRRGILGMVSVYRTYVHYS